jgi:hypothetical protein
MQLQRIAQRSQIDSPPKGGRLPSAFQKLIHCFHCMACVDHPRSAPH